ncbi:MAG: hypothetical protein GHCLOJNM_00293 [bacterium]|nr:hypothetical protein [bacterium]
MEDPKLEADIDQVKELIGIWQSYFKLLLAAFDKEKALPPDADAQFQKVKTVVAQRHDHFSKVITKDHYVAQNILQMVKRTISIFDFEKSSPVAIDKTLIEWHEANILLYETLGSLEFKKHELSKVSESEHKKELAARARKEKIERIKANRELFAVLKLILILGAAAGVWFSPIPTMISEVPFVRARINDFRNIFGYEELPMPGEASPKGAGAEEGK